MPKVSVIIPCYNLGEYLEEAVDSILAQTFQDFEIIIVNDGSTDDLTIRILGNLNNPQIKVLTTPNQGLPAARNTGIKVSSGKYICCLDADDIYEPSFLEKTSKVLDEDINYELGFVTTWIQAFGEENYIWKTDSYNPYKLAFENTIHVASLFRRECWEKVGGYATNLSGYQDWNFWISIISKGYKWSCIPEPLFLYRKRSNSMLTNSNKKRFLLFNQIIDNNKIFYTKNINEILLKALEEILNKEVAADKYLNVLQEIRKDYENTNRKLQTVNNELLQIKSSRSYKAILKFNQLVNVILPNKSIRRKFFLLVIDECIKLLKKFKIYSNLFIYWKIIRYVKGLKNNSRDMYLTQKKISIIMLSFNRFSDIKKAIKNVYKYTRFPFEFIILDNNSKPNVKNRLKKIAQKHSNMRIIFEETNLGAAGGKKKALEYATSDYVLYLDNDIFVLPNYLEGLIRRIEEDEKIVGVCCKVIFPNGKIQFNGGKMVVDDGFAIFSLIDDGLPFNSFDTNHYLNCDWIPGGATLWKKDLLKHFNIDENMRGSFEDNENSFRIIKGGYRLVNSPHSLVIHNHMSFKGDKFLNKEKDYIENRYNNERIMNALVYFYKCHGLILSFGFKENPWQPVYYLTSKEQIIEFINNQ